MREETALLRQLACGVPLRRTVQLNQPLGTLDRLLCLLWDEGSALVSSSGRTAVVGIHAQHRTCGERRARRASAAEYKADGN